METCAAKQIGIEREKTDHKAENDSSRGKNSDAALFDPFVPIMSREKSKAQK